MNSVLYFSNCHDTLPAFILMTVQIMAIQVRVDKVYTLQLYDLEFNIKCKCKTFTRGSQKLCENLINRTKIKVKNVV